MAVEVDGGPVERWVQEFADLVNAKFGITHIMTYPGHQPTQRLALDIFPKSRAQGDALARFAIEILEPADIDYIMWWWEIYNPEVLRGWRPVADRGSPTQNHEDHLHFSFESRETNNSPLFAGGYQEDDDMIPRDERFLPEDRHILHEVKDSVRRSDANDQSTNKAVERLEVTVRDPLVGLAERMENLESLVKELVATVKGKL